MSTGKRYDPDLCDNPVIKLLYVVLMDAASRNVSAITVKLVDADKEAEEGVVVEYGGVIQERMQSRLFGVFKWVFRFLIEASTDWRILEWITCNKDETEWTIDLSDEQIGEDLIQRLFDDCYGQ